MVKTNLITSFYGITIKSFLQLKMTVVSVPLFMLLSYGDPVTSPSWRQIDSGNKIIGRKFYINILPCRHFESSVIPEVFLEGHFIGVHVRYGAHTNSMGKKCSTRHVRCVKGSFRVVRKNNFNRTTKFLHILYDFSRYGFGQDFQLSKYNTQSSEFRFNLH